MEQKESETITAPKAQGADDACKWRTTLLVNLILLWSGVAMSISGLILQFNYHLLKKASESLVLALGQTEWNTIHVWTSIVFSTAAIYHMRAHRKWYKQVLKKKLLQKHRSTLILTLLMCIVVISGLIPLCIRYFGGSSMLRFPMIEIHDKAAILFFVIAFFHTAKRLKWYFKRLKTKFQGN